MPLSSDHFKPAARYLHWLTALLILSTIPAGVIMVREGLSRPTQDMLFLFHKNVGVVILILMLARLAYRVMNPPPPLPDSVPLIQQKIAKATHWLLYLLVIVMAVSGYIRVKADGYPLEGLDALGVPSLVPKAKALAKTAEIIHLNVRYAVIALILVHVGAALYHAVIKRDSVFGRMWRG